MHTNAVTILVLVLLMAAQGRQIPVEHCLDEPAAGVASTTVDGTLYLATWKRVDEKNEWIDFASREKNRWKKLLTVRNDTYEWQSISMFPDSGIGGFVVRSRAGDYLYGHTKVFAVVDGTIKLVYDNGTPTEIVDVNHDEYPELIASEWPAGDGTPATSDVYVWQNRTYKKLLTVPFHYRYGRSVAQQINKHLYGAAK